MRLLNSLLKVTCEKKKKKVPRKLGCHTETATVRDDASSFQSVDVTQIYLDEVGGVNKK